MKTLICTFLFLTVFTSTRSQDPVEILKKARIACQAIKEGTYETTGEKRWMSRKDTTSTLTSTAFKKSATDSLIGFLFDNHVEKLPYPPIKNIYTGNELVRLFPDSTAEITNCAMHPDQIRLMKRVGDFFRPITDRNQYPIPVDSNLTNEDVKYNYVGSEKVQNELCHIIDITMPNDNEPGDPMQQISHRIKFWIRQSDFIPLSYAVTVEMVMNNDTMLQYDKLTLTKYNFKEPVNESLFSVNTIPSFYKIKEFTPYKMKDPLPVSATAPEWELKTAEGKSIRLDEFKGKVVLLDFYYKGCYPCMLAISELKQLHEKYKDSGLVVIGMNPVDKPEEVIEFKKKRGITYLSVVANHEIVEKYQVQGYPTFYLIDKNGKIIFSHSGYESGKMNIPEQLILDSL